MERGLETMITTIRIAMYHFMKGSGLAGAAHLIFMRIGFARSVLVWTRDFLFDIGLDWFMVWIVYAHGWGTTPALVGGFDFQRATA